MLKRMYYKLVSWMKWKKLEHEIMRAFICEDEPGDGGDGGDKELSLIDIKAAIAKQNIPVSDLFSAQDMAANRIVIKMVRDAENNVRKGLEGEIVVLKDKTQSLQTFKDKREVVELVTSSKLLTDKGVKLIQYMKKRFSTGNLVDLSGDLTDVQRQAKINEAIEAEIKLVEEMGIDFKEPKKEDDMSPKIKTPFDDDEDKIDYTKAENNPLIPTEAK